MRFLHLADLHIGKRLNNILLLEDQRYALKQVVETAQDPSIDAVLIAGDIYDKPSPQAEAMALFDEFLTQLSRAGKKIYIISGNHDSDKRTSYYSGLIRDAGIYVSEDFDGKLQTIETEDEYGPIRIHLLPFLKPVHVKQFYPKEKIVSYEDAVRVVLENSPVDTLVRNILICHQFITNAQTSDSEELAIGGLDNVSAALFKDFDYVALGHIHKPQFIERETLRYAGSLLKYSFSEAYYDKSMCLVDVKEKGNVQIETKPIWPLHEVREVDGYLNDILQEDWTEDYVRVTLHDEEIAPDARLQLLAIYPNMMKMRVVNSKTQTEEDVVLDEAIRTKSVRELFSDFYETNNGVLPNEKIMALLDDVLQELEDVK